MTSKMSIFQSPEPVTILSFMVKMGFADMRKLSIVKYRILAYTGESNAQCKPSNNKSRGRRGHAI